MKHFLLALFALFISLAIVVPDAEARRLGGGRNSGMQRDNNFMKRDAAPQTPAKPQPGAAPQTPQKRSWMCPIAGLAAGLGLAALASHLGFREAIANVLMPAPLATAPPHTTPATPLYPSIPPAGAQSLDALLRRFERLE